MDRSSGGCLGLWVQAPEDGAGDATVGDVMLEGPTPVAMSAATAS